MDDLRKLFNVLETLRSLFVADSQYRPVLRHVQPQILRVILSLLIVFCLLILPVYIFWEEGRFRTLGVLAIVLSATILSILLFRAGKFRFARNLILSLLFLAITGSLLTSGGIFSPTISTLYVLLLLAGLLLSNRTLLVVFTLSLILMILLVVLEANGILPEPWLVHTGFTRLIIFSILLIFMLLLVYLFTNTVRMAIGQVTAEVERRKESEQETQLILDTIDSAVAVLTPAGEFIESNQAFKLLTGAGEKPKSIKDVFPDSAGQLGFGERQPYPKGDIEINDLRNQRVFHVSVKPIQFRNLESVLMTVHDITELRKVTTEQNKMLERVRKQRAALLKLAFTPEIYDGNIEAIAKLITENAANATRVERVSIWLGDIKNGELVCIDLFERTKNKHSSGHVLKATDYPRYFQTLQRSRVIDAEDAFNDPRTRDFASGYLQNSGIVSMLDASIRIAGKVEGIVCFEHTVSKRIWTPDEIRFAGEMADHMAQAILNMQRKTADQALRMSEQRYRFLVERLPESAIVLYNEDLRFLLVDGPEIAANGFSKDQMEGKTLYEMFSEEYIAVFEPNMRYVFTGKHHSAELAFNDKWYLYHYVPIRDDKDNVVYGLMVARNITSRRKAQDELSRSEEKYRRLFREDLSANVILTPDGRVIDANPAYTRLFGFDELKQAKSLNYPSLFRTTSLWKDILNALKKNPQLEFLENEMVTPDGKSIYVISNYVASYNFNNEITEIKGYLLDDSKRRELENQLVQSQKLQSIGTLAGGIAHDFNNLLAIILGRAQMMENRLKSDTKLQRDTQIIQQAAERGTSMVRQLLTFARKSEVRTSRVQINDVVSEIEKIVTETFPKNITFEKIETSGIPSIQGDSTQLYQVLLNLCVNSRDAMPGGGTIRIETKIKDGDVLNTQIRNAIARSYIQINMTDTGMGIPSNVINRIFEPFFTTKDVGKGTGLGLSVAYGIISAHRGFVEVDSQPGEGTTFKIYLPVDEVVVETDGMEVQSLASVKGGNERILLIEDEEMLRDLVMEVLLSKGYHVISAYNGMEAIDILNSRTESIDLILSDFGLPVMNGGQLFEYVKNLMPGVPFILASGFIDPAEREKLVSTGIKWFIEKPYRPEELSIAIRKALDNR